MKKEALSLFPHLDWSLWAFFIFLSVFLGVLAWVFRRGSKPHYEQISRFPFGEDEA